MLCYSLPYGALGFVSHFLTYYTIVCLWFGRSPLWPWRKVKYSRFDLWLGLLGLLIATGLAIFTLVRCRNTWQLLTIAVWKLSMSLLNGLTAINVATVVLKADVDDDGNTKTSAYWVVLCELIAISCIRVVLDRWVFRYTGNVWRNGWPDVARQATLVRP